HVASDDEPPRAQFAHGEVGDRAGGLRDQPALLKAGAAPVADVEARHAPVDAVQAAAADDRARSLLEEQQEQILALDELHVRAADGERNPSINPAATSMTDVPSSSETDSTPVSRNAAARERRPGTRSESPSRVPAPHEMKIAVSSSGPCAEMNVHSTPGTPAS